MIIYIIAFRIAACLHYLDGYIAFMLILIGLTCLIIDLIQIQNLYSFLKTKHGFAYTSYLLALIASSWILLPYLVFIALSYISGS